MSPLRYLPFQRYIDGAGTGKMHVDCSFFSVVCRLHDHESIRGNMKKKNLFKEIHVPWRSQMNTSALQS